MEKTVTGKRPKPENMNPSSEQEHIAVYREKITDEICKAFGFSPNGVMRRLLGPLFRLPTSRFGRIAVRVDDEVGSSGLSGGARLILPDLSLEVTARGSENIPVDGPLLVVSNHPGAFDSVAILSCIPRKDVKVLLSDVPFTRAFGSARRYFIYVPPDASGRMTTFWASIDHLKSGGALLIFAHGDVEPDPEVSPGADECIQDWSRSVEMMLRAVPDCRLQVTIASGVLLPKFVFSPIVKIRKTAAKRQKLAEFLQISRQMAFAHGDKTHVHISFAEPVRGMDIARGETMSAVIDIARRLLKDHLESLGINQRSA
jgi:hypothetical protein